MHIENLQVGDYICSTIAPPILTKVQGVINSGEGSVALCNGHRFIENQQFVDPSLIIRLELPYALIIPLGWPILIAEHVNLNDYKWKKLTKSYGRLYGLLRGKSEHIIAKYIHKMKLSNGMENGGMPSPSE